MQGILQSKYYNLGENKVGKYLLQTRSQAKSRGIKMPEEHGIGKGIDLNILQEKQVIQPIAVMKMKIKPRLGQGRAGLRRKIRALISTLIKNLL